MTLPASGRTVSGNDLLVQEVKCNTGFGGIFMIENMLTHVYSDSDLFEVGLILITEGKMVNVIAGSNRTGVDVTPQCVVPQFHLDISDRVAT